MKRLRKPPSFRAPTRSGWRSPRPTCCWSPAPSARRKPRCRSSGILHTRLAPFKRIRKLELVTELPKTISGKIRRVQLRRLEHDNNRDDALRGQEFREEEFRSCRGAHRRVGELIDE